MTVTQILFIHFSGLVVSMLATGPMGPSVAGSGSAKDGGFLWMIKIHSTLPLERK
jgi:hypothetical protein